MCEELGTRDMGGRKRSLDFCEQEGITFWVRKGKVLEKDNANTEQEE